MAARHGKRLQDWKEIAAYFGRDERTVRRWEHQRGLPVHRLAGGARSIVYAYADELEAWLRSNEQPPEPATPSAEIVQPVIGPEPAGRIAAFTQWRMPAIALIAAFTLAAATFFLPGRHSADVSGYRPNPAVNQLYLDAVYQLDTRQAVGLQRAIAGLTEVTSRDPKFASAFAKLAEAYNVVSQYTDAPASESYPKAIAAAEKALQLEPDNAAALASLAFSNFYWRKDFPAAQALFMRSIAIDPRAAKSRHWYALTLMVVGEVESALPQIEAARDLAPETRSLIANLGLIQFYNGQVEPAIATLKQLAESDPKLRSPHEYLATVYLAQKRYVDFLHEYRTAAEVANSQPRLAIAAAAERGFAVSGARGLLEAMLAEQRLQLLQGNEPAYKLAATAALLGHNDEAIACLEESARRGEQHLGIWVEPPYRTLRSDERYLAIVRQMGVVPAAAVGEIKPPTARG